MTGLKVTWFPVQRKPCDAFPSPPLSLSAASDLRVDTRMETSCSAGGAQRQSWNITTPVKKRGVGSHTDEDEACYTV